MRARSNLDFRDELKPYETSDDARGITVTAAIMGGRGGQGQTWISRPPLDRTTFWADLTPATLERLAADPSAAKVIAVVHPELEIKMRELGYTQVGFGWVDRE